jgi:DNA-binding transcriptional MocR family regulator
MTIDLSGSPPRWPTSAAELWRRCLTDAATQQDLSDWSDPQGDDVLRAELGRELNLSGDYLTITASLRAAALTYARRSDHIVIEQPTFDGAVRVLSGGHATVELRGWDRLDEASVRPGSTIWVTSPCRNPDGRTMSSAEYARLGGMAARGHRVVVNEAYRWFHPDAPRAIDVDLAGTLHKLAGVDARIGWVYSTDYFEEAFHEMVGTTPSSIWQRAWGLFLRRGGLVEVRTAVAGKSLAAAEAFKERLALLGGQREAAFDGVQTILPLAEGVREPKALDVLFRAGFKLVGGSAFHCRRPALRVSFLGAQSADGEKFAEAMCASKLFATDSGQG